MSIHPFWEKVVLFGILDCSHNLQTLICVIIIKAIQFWSLVDGHIMFEVSF